jgi:hypothetical protein
MLKSSLIAAAMLALVSALPASAHVATSAETTAQSEATDLSARRKRCCHGARCARVNAARARKAQAKKTMLKKSAIAKKLKASKATKKGVKKVVKVKRAA